ncbi:MAG: hypothetical protein ACI90V_013737, partial [Bacillariaceae sp.]
NYIVLVFVRPLFVYLMRGNCAAQITYSTVTALHDVEMVLDPGR